MILSNAGKVSLLELSSIFEAITKSPIHSDMGQPDQGDLQTQIIAIENAENCQSQWENDGMDQIVGNAPQSWVDWVK